ncbi:hypothetical protein CKA32_001440 [Geitlerinema sp. FC II]|nr:hypothetical protein CKA32_001440 [Geitlerinema sp. FC II]
MVSIPQRDFGEFQPHNRTKWFPSFQKFQSLKGILVNFNFSRGGFRPVESCFNPSKGFW